MQQGPRVAVIGLDCGTPQLLFGDLAAEVPNIAKLMSEGMYGDLASIAADHGPCLGVRDDGRDARRARDTASATARTRATRVSRSHSGSIDAPAVWDTLGAQGKSSLLIGVPPGFPPPRSSPAGASAAS